MNEKLTLQDIVDLLAKKTSITKKEADTFFREFFALITDNIYKNEAVKIKDFGTFKLTKVSSRESVDVNTGEKIEIPSHYKFSFQPDKALKNAVNRPFSHFETTLIKDDLTFDSMPVSEELDEDENDAPEDEAQALQELTPKVAESPSPSYVYTYTTTSSSNNQDEDKPITLSVPTDKLVKPIVEERPFTSNRVQQELQELKETMNASSTKEEKEVLEVVVEKETPTVEPEPQALLSSRELEIEQFKEAFINKTEGLENKDAQALPSKEEAVSTKELTPNNAKEEKEDDELLEDYTFDHNFYDYQPSKVSKILRGLPIILIVLAAVIFGIFKFEDLFNDKQKYEYYRDYNRRLTDSDTLPFVGNKDPNFADSLRNEIQEKRYEFMGGGIKPKRDSTNPKTTIDKTLSKNLLPTDSTTVDVDIESNMYDAEISKHLKIKIVNKAAYTRSLHAITIAPVSETTPPTNTVAEPASADKRITVKSGESLRTLASKNYGNPVFWVYIYEENKQKIKNVDNLNVGMSLTIPSLQKYGIDPNLSDDIKKAKQLEAQLLR